MPVKDYSGPHCDDVRCLLANAVGRLDLILFPCAPPHELASALLKQAYNLALQLDNKLRDYENAALEAMPKETVTR